MPHSPLVRIVAVLPALALAAAPHAQAPTPIAASIQRIAQAYEQGNCRDVLAAITATPRPAEAFALDGLTQYRWGYCLAASGQAGDEAHYRLAADLLGDELKAPSARLDAYFYRANALLNLRRNDEALATAKLAAARFTAGQFTVAADSPQAWFQLGKLFADAGDTKGALGWYRRAVDASAAGKRPLRSAYAERIAAFALEQNDLDLARRADALRPRAPETGANAPLRDAGTKLAAGDLAGARTLFTAAAKGTSDAATEARYAIAALDRLGELAAWHLEPVRTTADGHPLTAAAQDEVRRGLAESARAAWQLIESGDAVEIPRRSGTGTRPAPAPAVDRRLQELQARFAGFLLEALRRQVPLQEWAVVDGYPQLIHNEWRGLFVQRVNRTRLDQLIDQ